MRGTRSAWFLIPIVAVVLIGASAVFLRPGALPGRLLGDPPLHDPITPIAWFAAFALIGLAVLPEFDDRGKDGSDRQPGAGAADIPTSAFDHAPYGVILVNPDGGKAYVNAAYTDITGYAPGETKTLIDGIGNLFPDPAYRQMVMETWQKAMGRSGVERTLHCVCKNGEEKDVQFRTASLDDGRMMLMMADVTAQSMADRTARARLDIERAIAEVSTKLVSGDDVNAAIPEALQILGNVRGASRGHLYRFTEDGEYAEITHEWCAPGTAPIDDHLRRMSAREFKWWADQLLNGEAILVNDPDMLPPEAQSGRALMQARAITSCVLMPLHVGGRIVGFMAFDNREGAGAWKHDDLVLLRTSAEIIGHALDRYRAHQDVISSEERYRTLVESTPDVIFCMNGNGELTSLNMAFETTLGLPRDEWLGKSFLPLIHTEDQPLATESFLNCLFSGEKSEFYVLRVLHASGEYRQGEFAISPIRHEGRVVGVQGFARDISDRQRAANALRESEERYRELVECAQDVIYTLGPDGTLTSLNKAFETTLGWKRDEWVGQSFAPLVHPDDMSEAVNGFMLVMAGETQQSVMRVRTTEGEYKTGDFTSVPFMQDGTVIGVLAIARDITERQKAEQAVRESEERLRSVVDNALDVIYTLAPDGTITSMNPAIEAHTGWRADELIGKTFAPIIHPQDVPISGAGFERNLQGETIVGRVMRVLGRDGTYRIGEFTTTPLRQNGEVIGVLGIARDVTERERIDAELRAALDRREELETIINKSPAIAFTWRATEQCPTEYVSDNITMFGYTPDDVLSGRITFGGIMHPDDFSRVAEDVAQHMIDEEDEFSEEYRIITASGEIRWVDDRTWVCRNDKKEITHYQGIMVDITAREAAQEDLRRALKRREELESIINKSPAVAFAWRPVKGRPVTFMSDSVAQFGYSAEEFTSGARALDELIHEDDRQYVTDDTRARLANGEAEFSHQYRINTKSGKVRWVEDRKYVEYDDQGHPVLCKGIAMDITDRKVAEQALQDSENLLSSIIDQSPVPTWIADPQGRSIRRNVAYTELFGTDYDVETGAEYCILADPAIAEQGHLDAVAAVFEGGDTARFTLDHELTRAAHAITHRVLEVTIFPVKDESGRVINAVIQHEDITERVRAERELRKTMSELERFNRLSVGRELRMIELKREVNQMALQARLDPPYDLSFADEWQDRASA